MSSFNINKINSFPALTAPISVCFFFSNLFIAFHIKLFTNPGKSSVAKGIAMFVSAFLNYLTKNQKIYRTELF